MAKWNPKVETVIRKFADYQHRQMKDAVNPRATLAGSALRMIFRAKAYGLHAYKDVCSAMGLEYDLNTAGAAANFQKMIDLAESNHSDAADKLKKVMPIVEQFMKDFAAHPNDMFQNLKIAKRKNLAL